MELCICSSQEICMPRSNSQLPTLPTTSNVKVRLAFRGQEIVSVASQGDRFKCISCVPGCQPQA
jgi:hypothetical protein